MARILMVVSAADSLTMKDGTQHPTGFWAEELVTAHRLLTEAGHTVNIATPGGKQPTVDAISLDPQPAGGQAKADEYAAYLKEIEPDLSSPLVLSEVSADYYNAIVLPGGHGPMADLATDANLGRLLTEADREGIIIAPFCHGPAALLSATNDAGEFAFAGRRLTVFTDEEELGGGTGDNTPWLVESTLRENGAIVHAGPAWQPNLVRDANLITGQNPASSEVVAREVLAALGPAPEAAQDDEADVDLDEDIQ